MAAVGIRLLGGLFAGNGVDHPGLIADVTPPEKRTRSMSYMGAAWNVGLIVGPFMGGVFARPSAGPIGFQLPLLISAGLFLASASSSSPSSSARAATRDMGTTFRPNRWAATGEAARHPVIGPADPAHLPGGLRLHRHRVGLRPLDPGRYGWGPQEIGWAFAIREPGGWPATCTFQFSGYTAYGMRSTNSATAVPMSPIRWVS